LDGDLGTRLLTCSQKLMTDSSSSASPPSPGDRPGDDSLNWTGRWRVQRYGGEVPDAPTFYEATTESWDVIKVEPSGLHVARHPILEIDGSVLLLKDEGAPDTETERWRVDVNGQQLRVVAETGEHAGAVGVAERTDADPRAIAAA